MLNILKIRIFFYLDQQFIMSVSKYTLLTTKKLDYM